MEKLRFKKVGMFMFFLLQLVTLGLYLGIWLYLRKDELNKLSRTAKLEDYMPISILLLSAAYVGGQIYGAGGISGMLSFVSFVITIIAAFRIRDMMREYAQNFDTSGLAVQGVMASGVMTFFFTFFYAQYHINKLIDAGYIERVN